MEPMGRDCKGTPVTMRHYSDAFGLMLQSQILEHLGLRFSGTFGFTVLWP